MTRRLRERPQYREPPAIDGRVPPSDLDAEAAVLSACLLDREAFDEVAPMLRREHFYSEANGLVFEALMELEAAGQPLDVVTVNQHLRSRELADKVGGPKYLARLVDATPAIANVSAHAEIVRELWRLRRSISIGHYYAALGYGEIVSVASHLDAMQGELSEIASDGHRSDLEPLRELLVADMRELVEAAERGNMITGIPTRYADLDKKTAGLHRGDLMIVAARPGMGKTGFVGCLAANIASKREDVRTADDGYTTERVTIPGDAVALFSLEMPKKQMARRLACSESRVDLGRLRTGGLTGDDWAALSRAGQDLADLPIEIDDTAAITLSELRAKVRKYQARLERARRVAPGAPRLGVVIVDYLQLMSGTGREQNREQEIATISRGLKQLAKDLDVAVVALSQLNRGVETRAKDKRPMLSDLRESGAIEQDADIVVFIYRDEYYNEASQDRGIAELIIAKQRNGPTGTVRLRFIGSCTRFENLATGEYNEKDWG